ncbi:MAG: radical SAM protein, partial [Candidatus Hydrothermarchaeales archaeon]
MKITTATCKTALSPSRLLGYDYALNPYRGCQHACAYCYAPYVLREDREWGSFADVKLNIPTVLAKELRKKPKGVVGISTVTDPYQPIEKRYELTRRCLRELLKRDFPICIQTKSSLVLRDIDLLERFSQKEVGFTLTTINDDLRKRYEPNASSVEERLKAIEVLANRGIKTWVFLGPIMPYITTKDNDLEALISALKRAKADYIIVDRLNIKRG